LIGILAKRRIGIIIANFISKRKAHTNLVGVSLGTFAKSFRRMIK
jgi:hypothetical protein